MGFLIDSSVFIAAERGHLSIAQVVADQEDEPRVLSAVTASGVLHGVHRTTDQARRARREQFVAATPRRFPVIECELEAAKVHARMWAQLAAEGEQIGAHDLPPSLLRLWPSMSRSLPRTFAISPRPPTFGSSFCG